MCIIHMCIIHMCIIDMCIIDMCIIQRVPTNLSAHLAGGVVR